MAVKQELAPRKTDKSTTVTAIVDHIIDTYRPQQAPCVLMWRELMNSFNRKGWAECPLWTRDDTACHEHWKKYGPAVVSVLKQQYRLTVVKVSGKIREVIKHGMPPDRGGKRTDERYRACLPHATEMVRGIVVFPRNSQQDHPLIVASLDRRGRAAATGLENAVTAVDTANDLGVLSDSSREEIRGHVGTVARRAIEEKMPLFPRKAIEA